MVCRITIISRFGKRLDEYLKWICGFANAQGGTLFIGKDDNGNVVGMKNVQKLFPNVSVSELKQETFEFFKEKGIESKRLSENSRKDTPEQLLNNLKLIDNGYPTAICFFRTIFTVICLSRSKKRWNFCLPNTPKR
jgi:predicted HTH transcriptional regulator